ncbi:V-type ATPase 116kDa subunit family protein [Clostridioides difficile]|uniref:V-type ATPase 116kDa subunit family protein n=1 Tax=Clostridioides difficile TaxID=1496 RepID=UPI001F2E8E76
MFNNRSYSTSYQPFRGYAGPILAVVIGVVGHTINLLINALGAYVHTSRLQYVEFFNKFYEGGGVPFVPFKYKTKYTSINKKEM